MQLTPAEVAFLNEAKDTFIVSREIIPEFKLHREINGMGIIVNYSCNTNELYYTNAKNHVCILGLCIDSQGVLQRNDIPEFIANIGGSVNEVYKECGRFAGKYIILFSHSCKCFFWGDATSTIPIYYGTGDTLCVGSTDKLVAIYLNHRESRYSWTLKQGYCALGVGFLPGDVSMYDDIKVLLPNHFLDMQTMHAVRVPLDISRKKENDKVACKQLVYSSIKLANTILSEYRKYTDFVLPLTAGYDSRVVFSFLRNQIDEFECYTFRLVTKISRMRHPIYLSPG